MVYFRRGRKSGDNVWYMVWYMVEFKNGIGVIGEKALWNGV